MPEDSPVPLPEYRLDRTALAVVSLEDQDDEGAYWRTKTPLERLQAFEYLRRMAYGTAATARLQRVMCVVDRDETGGAEPASLTPPS